MINILRCFGIEIDNIKDNIGMRFEIQDQHIAETLEDLEKRVKYLEDYITTKEEE